MRSLLFLILLFTLQVSSAKIKLPAVIGSNMVLQRHADIRLWGTCNMDTLRVTTSWDARVYPVAVDSQDQWQLSVTTPDAGGPYEILFDDGDRVLLSNILIGEVWVCSGQSNMEMPMRGFDSQPCTNSLDALIKAGSYPRIRLFHVARAASDTPQADCKGYWQESSLSSAAAFSAVAYYFGLNLYDALQIPIGLIESDWGGTRIEAWMSREAAQSVDPKIISTNQNNNHQNQVGALYNGMITPLAPFSARGFLWYQGESNKGYHKKYARDMAALVDNWRTLWHNRDMPFYYVQIAPFDYDIPMHRFNGEKNSILSSLLVEAQLEALHLIPNSGMAVNTDLGDAIDIHPPHKDKVGQRLALLALNKTYGLDGIDSQGVMFKSVTFDGGAAIVEFESKSTLYPINKPLLGFEIAGADRVFYSAAAYVIHQDYDFSRKVSVCSPQVTHPVAVRYAFHNIVSVNLTNTMGLPAFPFRTDAWDDVH